MGKEVLEFHLIQDQSILFLSSARPQNLICQLNYSSHDQTVMVWSRRFFFRGVQMLVTILQHSLAFSELDVLRSYLHPCW